MVWDWGDPDFFKKKLRRMQEESERELNGLIAKRIEASEMAAAKGMSAYEIFKMTEGTLVPKEKTMPTGHTVFCEATLSKVEGGELCRTCGAFFSAGMSGPPDMPKVTSDGYRVCAACELECSNVSVFLQHLGVCRGMTSGTNRWTRVFLGPGPTPHEARIEKVAERVEKLTERVIALEKAETADAPAAEASAEKFPTVVPYATLEAATKELTGARAALRMHVSAANKEADVMKRQAAQLTAERDDAIIKMADLEVKLNAANAETKSLRALVPEGCGFKQYTELYAELTETYEQKADAQRKLHSRELDMETYRSVINKKDARIWQLETELTATKDNVYRALMLLEGKKTDGGTNMPEQAGTKLT